MGTDYWVLALLVLGIGSVGGAINIIATVITLRAPGLTIRRLPLFVWMTFVTAILIILALPVLNAALVMLLIDRRLDAHFFQANGGGSAILWQHFFWTFGHPEVYIMALPAFGMISEVIPVFSRKPIFGYEFVAGVDGGHRHPELRRVGAPHVRRRARPPRRPRLRHREHGYRRPDGGEDLQLDRDDVGRRRSASRRRCCSPPRSSSSSSSAV